MLPFLTPLRRKLRRWMNPAYQRRQRELSADLAQTQAMIGAWAGQGGQQADPQKQFVIISFTNLPLHAKFHGLAAKTMQLHGYTPVVFTYEGTRFGHQYLKLFGIDQLVMWEDFAAKTTNSAQIERIVAGLLPKNSTVEQVLGLQFHGVDVGKHAMSVTARKLFQGKFDLNQPEIYQLLRDNLTRAVQGVIAAEAFFDTHPVKKMLVRDSGYIPNGAIYEVGLLRGVDCIVYEQGQRRGSWIFKRYTPDTKTQHYFSISRSTWEQIKAEPWTSADDARLETLFAGRYKPDSTDDTRRLMTGKQLKPPEEVRQELGLDPAKKTAVIFSHIAWDAAFFYGSCLFDDFEHWLFETVKFVAAECPDMNWVVKLHPFNVFKLQREKQTEESEMRLLRTLMPLPDHVRIMRASTPINTQSLFPVIDYVLTVNGTVGMEFPCFGIPALLAGTGRYNGLGFTIEPPTRAAYLEQLTTLHSVPRLSAEQQMLAKRHFYAVVERRQTDLSDVAPMELKRVNEAESDVHDNIQIAAHSLEEFGQKASILRLGEWLAESSAPDIFGTNVTRILYVVRGEPISPDYSGASSRYDQNFAALTRLYSVLDVLRLDEAAAFERTYAFEQQSETAQRVRQQAASWQDVIVPPYQPAHSRMGRLWQSLADPATVEFEIKPETLAALRDQIERCKPDLIWVEGTRLAAPLTKIHTPLPWILSQHDILSNVHRIRRGNDTLSKRWKLLIARRAEARVLSASPLIVTGSTSDAQRSQALGAPRVEVISMAYESLLPAPSESASPPLYVAHLGSLETTANRVGLEAYLRKVQPELSRAGVTIPLLIIGDSAGLKDPLQSLLRDAHVDLKGFVPDLGEVLRPFNVAILPYESDSGYRTKLPVLFNHAQVVVTTRAAVQGMWIDGLDQVCIVLDRLEDFPSAIMRLLAAPDERERLGRAAHEFYAAHWTLDAVIEQYRRVIDGVGE